MQNGAKSGYKCKRPKIKCKQRFLPSLQNYPSLEANEQARRAVIMDTINDRLVAAELAQLESAHRKVVGGGGGGSANGGGGSGGTGGGSGGGTGGGGGKAKAAEPTRAGDAGEGDGNEAGGDDPDPEPRRSRNQRRRESQSAHGASSAGVGTVVAKTIEELIRAGALSGAPGGVPSAGPHDRPFVIDPEVMGKASERGLESCGSTPKPLCRKCNTWMFCGKPFMGKTLKCQKDMAVFDHESYKDDTALPAVILNAMTHQGGFVRGPCLDTNAKKWAMYNALVAMPAGTVKTVREWLKWFPEVKFGESSEPPAPTSIDLGDVELQAHTSDPSNESLSNLIAANGGPEAFATFLDSERELKEILDARADKSFLQSACTMVTPPTPGVAATTDCGEPQQHA